MRAWLFLGASSAVAVAMLQGCGGSGKSTGTGGSGTTTSTSTGKATSSTTSTSTSSSGAGGATSSSTTGSSSTGSSSTGSSSTGSSSAGSSSTGSSTSSTGSTTSSSSSSSGGGTCPSELGPYTVSEAGQGCGDLDLEVPQCIKAGNSACQVVLVGQTSAGSAVNGTVNLDASGDFTGGSLSLGSTARTGCTGTWSASMSKLVIDCGGMGTTQSCVVTLTRSGPTCP